MISENKNDLDFNKVPFEIALDRAGFGLYSYLVTALTGLSIISMVCIAYSTTILAPTSACELGTTTAQQGYIVVAPIVGLILGAILWGRLADLKGRRKMLLVSICAAAFANALASISVNWIMLMIIQFIAASCASGQYSIAMALLGESVPLARRNVLVLIVSSIFMLSQGIMSLMALPIIPLHFSYYISGLDIYWNPWRTLILVYCAPSIICFIWLYFMQESPKYVFNSLGDEERALEILRVIHRINNGKSKEELQVKGLQKDESQAQDTGISQLFKAPLLKYLIIMTLVAIFLKTSAFMVWLPTIMGQFVQVFQTGENRDFTLCQMIRESQESPVENDLPPCALDETSLLLLFAVGAVQSLFNICISLVVNKTGRRNMAIVVSATCGVSGILVNLVPNAIASGLLMMVFLLGMVLTGLYSAISMALFPTTLRAVALSVTATGGRVFSIIIVQVLNWLLVNNCDLGFYIFASIVASSAVILSFLPDDRRLTTQTAPKSVEDAKPEMQEYGQLREEMSKM